MGVRESREQQGGRSHRQRERRLRLESAQGESKESEGGCGRPDSPTDGLAGCSEGTLRRKAGEQDGRAHGKWAI